MRRVRLLCAPQAVAAAAVVTLTQLHETGIKNRPQPDVDTFLK